MEEFKIILQDSKAEIEEKKSKFIAHVFYIENIEDVEQKIKEIRKKFFDARHHCYAYRIIEKNEIREKQSDDGEPSGTAGVPMLNILQKNEIFNVLVVVTRYFGGTLLGTGGLIRAYSDATLKGIENAGIGLQKYGYVMNVTIEYKDLERFKYYCRKNEISIINIIYEKEIMCQIELTKEKKEELIHENQKDVKMLEYAILKEKYIKTML